MSPITQTIRESLEYVDSMKMFPENEGSELIQYDRIGTEEIKSHLLQSQIKLVGAVIAEMQETIKPYHFIEKGYEALTDQIYMLTQVLEEFKNN